MHREEKRALEYKVGLFNDALVLTGKPEFQRLFMEHFMKTTVYELMYREGSSSGTMSAIDARKVFNDFIYDTIDAGKQAQETLKGN